MAGYSRQSTSDIVPTAVVKAAPINAEYNKLRDAFTYSSSATTGHRHDGDSDEGSFVPLIADPDGLNKIVVDTGNNRHGVFVEVSGSAVEQIRISDGLIAPVTDNDVDLGGSTLEFKDLHLDGTAHIDTLDVDANAGIIGTLTVTGVTALNGGLTMDSNKFTVANTSGNTAIAGTLAVTGATTLAATSFGDANITNVGNIALDSITADGSTITITGNTTFADGAFDFNIASHDTSNGLKLGGTLVTATAAELNILDGVTSTAAELNILDGVTSTATELNILDGVTATTAELNYLDVTTLGTSEASKVVTVNASGDLIVPDSDKFNFGAGSDMALYHDGTNSYITNKTGALKVATETSGIAITIGHTTSEVTVADNLTITGNLTVGGTQTVVDTVTMNAANAIVFEGATADAHETTLTIVDPTADRTINLPNQSGTVPVLAAASNTAITATPAELNIMDGGTSVTSTTLADADGVVVNDAGTMKQVAMSDINTYMQNNLNTQANLTTVGALNAGSITSGFGTINIGSSAFTTTGAVNFGSLNDGTIGVTAFVDEDNMSSNSATLVPTQQSVKAYVDSVSATANNVSGLTSTGAELNILDGATVTTAELNILDGSETTQATVTLAGTDGVVISDADVMKQALVSDFDTYMATTTKTLTNKTLTSAILNGTTLVGGDFITASNADLDLAPHGTGTVVVRGNSNSAAIVFNCESNSHGQKVFGQPHSAGVTNTLMLPAGANSTLVSLVSTDTLTNKTLTSPKINEDVAVTSTATELNILDGVTSTTAELNILDGVTSTAAELNILDGVTSTAAELNILDGVTSTAAELNLVDGSTAGTIVNSKAVVYSSGGQVNATTLAIAGTAITSTAAELNILDGVTSTAAELNILDGVTSTAAELNALDGITAVVGELNALDIGSTAVGTAVASKAVILDSNKDYAGMRNVTTTGLFKPVTYQETYVSKSAASTVTCDLATANHFAVTLDQNTTFAFSNPPASGTSFSFILLVTQHSTAVTLTWPNTVDWAGGSAPDAAGNNEVQAYGFVTRDNGTTYYGFLGGTAIG